MADDSKRRSSAWFGKADRDGFIHRGWLKNHGLNVANRSLYLDVPERELARRRDAWRRPAPPSARGWSRLYYDHVLQANRGANLDFLVGASGALVPKESH